MTELVIGGGVVKNLGSVIGSSVGVGVDSTLGSAAQGHNGAGNTAAWQIVWDI